MYPRPRASARALALALAPALGCALCAAPLLAQSGRHAAKRAASTRSSKPAARAASAGDTSGVVVATVNGENITRAQVIDDMLANQAAKLTVANPVFADQNRWTAGSVGALVLKHMAAHPGQPVTVTRAQITDWVFQDKPRSLYEAVQRLIAQHAILQAAHKAGITITPAEVAAQLTTEIAPARKQYNFSGSDAHVLAQMGFTTSFLRPIIETQIAMQKLVRRDWEQKIGHPLGPNDYVSASHIIVQVMSNPADKDDTEKKFAEAKKTIEGIAADIKSGKTTFEKAAAEHNTDMTKLNGGSLGVIVRDMPSFDPSFIAAAFKLKKGEVSEPVRSQFGWHLIRIDKTGSELGAADRKKALDEALQRTVQVKANDIVKSAKILNSVAPPAQPNPMQMGGG